MFLYRLLLAISVAAATTTSPKRGLLYIDSSTSSTDASAFLKSPNDLTWYYNYKPSPTSNIDLEFVPMLWGLDKKDSFVDTVQSQMKTKNISYVLAFNEPDQTSAVGGSNIDPRTAAAAWKSSIEPLAKTGVKLGAPAVSGGGSGLTWLKTFFAACDGCTVSFLPLHWYGSFEGLASHIGEVRAAYPNMTIWITELGWADQTLPVTQDFFNQSIAYMDRLDYVTRYTWFGAFRSSKSNVGPNGAMFNGKGQLTDLGAEYLGQPPTGVQPTTSNASQMAWSFAVLLAALVVAAVGGL